MIRRVGLNIEVQMQQMILPDANHAIHFLKNLNCMAITRKTAEVNQVMRRTQELLAKTNAIIQDKHHLVL